MKYMLLMYAKESDVPHTPEQIQVAAPAWYAFTTEAQAAGVLESASGLSSASNATTVRVRDGKVLTADGPFAETHEQLGGCYLLECKDLDEALAWAAKLPTAQYGSVEVRPLWSPKN